MQFGQLKRREFITLLGGAAVPWPFAARAQQPGMPVLGILNATSPETAFYLAGLRKGLREAGYVEGLNIEIETRWAEGQYDRLPALAAELVRRPVTVIAAGGIPPLMAAKAATSTIPIVFTSAGDPVQLGLVASLNRPGGNVTGVSHFGVTLAPKRLELLLKLVPNATVIAVLENPSNPRIDLEATELEAAAHATGKRLLVVKASNETEFETAFTTLLQAGVGGLLVAGEPLFILRRQQLVTLATRHAIPAIYDYRNFTTAGGLLSYGIDLTEMYHLVGGYVGRILKGAKPTDLPILQPTKFELAINLNTAKALGLNVPPTLLAIADEVIE
jgi:putative ABC transport system substrate-binding protein